MTIMPISGMMGIFIWWVVNVELKEKFEQAVQNSKNLSEKPGNEILLKLYGLYKQAKEGDNDQPEPGGFDFKAIAKHQAWKSLSGKRQEQAMQEYVDLVNSLMQSWSFCLSLTQTIWFSQGDTLVFDSSLFERNAKSRNHSLKLYSYTSGSDF